MKRKLFVFASATLLLVAPALAANKSTVKKSPSATASSKIPPIPASSQLQVPPAPVTPQAAPSAPSAGKVDKTIYTVAESRVYQSKTDRVQHFVDYINLKPGQEKLPLKLTFFNKGFNTLSCNIAGYPVLDRKKVTNVEALPVDMTGNIGAGSSQVLLDLTGAPDASFSWRLTAPLPTLKSAKPNEAGPGDSVTLTGTNFCPDAQWNTVSIGGKKATVKSASATSLEITVPDDIEVGKQKSDVTVIGQKTSSIELTIKATPEVTGISLNSAPPGQEIVVTGKHFSKNAGENKVTIGGVAASVVSGDSNSLTVIIPDGTNNPAYGLPVKVEVGKQQSKENVTIDIQTRVF
jgi:hypothetical protein